MPSKFRPMTRYQNHVRKWSGCKLCSLCDSRSKVVLLRGQLPCDVLFIGEAPGASEDVIGQPFVGPAGKLLDRIITEAFEVFAENIASYALTNLVGCIPKENGVKSEGPTAESIKACSPRLEEIITLCNPKGIVFVGSLATKWVAKLLVDKWPADQFVTQSILHPASILRMSVAQKGLAIQRCVVALGDIFCDLDESQVSF